MERKLSTSCVTSFQNYWRDDQRKCALIYMDVSKNDVLIDPRRRSHLSFVLLLLVSPCCFLFSAVPRFSCLYAQELTSNKQVPPRDEVFANSFLLGQQKQTLAIITLRVLSGFEKWQAQATHT
jgi:hypothetical protein